MVTKLLFGALLLLVEIPGQERGYVKPPSSTASRHIEWLENNTQLIYPALALLVVALIAFGVISAWRTEDMDGIQKAELKREIIRQLRRDVYGMTAVKLAQNLDIPGGKMLKLLEEMADQNIVESRTDTARVTTWRMRGLQD